MDLLSAWLALWRAPDIGPKTFFEIIRVFPHLDDFFLQVKRGCLPFKLSPSSLAALQKPDWKTIEEDILWASQPQHHIISWQDTHYPALLKQITYPPPLLFIWGDISVLNTPQFAMVGSRHPTRMGLKNAHDFAEQITLAGLTVTSGLAMGIDAACHRGALAQNGLTVAVMGTGPDVIYPATHQTLAEEIAERGAVISEFPLGVSVKASHFPRRNRIISGLSVGVLIVEAAMNSGSLITARYAAEQGRDVFAIPGSIHHPLSRGCHALIREGAQLVEGIEDIVENLSKNLLPQENPLASLLKAIGNKPTTIEEMVFYTRLTVQEVSSLLVALEIAGKIIAVPGGYQRLLKNET